MKLIETRRIDTGRVRSMCINNDYYTRGTCKEYDNMFKMCANCSVLTIAKDILEHSDKEKLKYTYGCSETEVLENICFGLINDCSYTCVEIKETFKVVEPYLDNFVVGEFDTMEEAETFLNECVEWDKKNPQGYTPYYVIEKE